MSETTDQRVALLSIVVNKLVNNDSLTEQEASLLADIAHLSHKKLDKYKEDQRALHKIQSLENQLQELYNDFPQFRPK